MPQAEAERRKRAQILESEGDRQSKINVAEGDKAQVILSSEAAKQDAINRATGQACWQHQCVLADAQASHLSTLCDDMRSCLCPFTIPSMCRRGHSCFHLAPVCRLQSNDPCQCALPQGQETLLLIPAMRRSNCHCKAC